MTPSRFMLLIFMSVSSLTSVGCSSGRTEHRVLIEPDGYVFMDADHGWGHIATLRIVDWGDRWVHVSVTDERGRNRVGALDRAEYRGLISELRGLGAFELESFERRDVFDADLYRIRVRDGDTGNDLLVYCPWESVGESPSPGMVVAGDPQGSKPHAELVRRLLEIVGREDWRWDVSTYAFHPAHHLVDTGGTHVADLYFNDHGALKYAVLEEPEWAGGTAKEENGCVVWRSAEGEHEEERVPFDVIKGGAMNGSGPMYPRPPGTVADTQFPELPEFEFPCELHHLAQSRVRCDGGVGVCVNTRNGIAIIAYLLADPTEYRSLLFLRDAEIHPRHIDLSPDGARAAWIDRGRLLVTETDADCASLMEGLGPKNR